MSLYIHFNTRGICFCHQCVETLKWKLVRSYLVQKQKWWRVSYNSVQLMHYNLFLSFFHLFCIFLLHLGVKFIIAHYVFEPAMYV